MTKSKFKNLVKARIIDYWEAYYRTEAHKLSSASLKYFKPEFMSLSHPHKIWTTCGTNPFEIHKAVIQARMLSGRYITDRLSRHWMQNQSWLCTIPGFIGLDIGSLEHYLLFCPALSPARSKVISLLKKVTAESDLIGNIIEKVFTNQTPEHIVQFLLDCTSFPDIILLEQSGNIALVERIFHVGRTWCYTMHRSRMNKLCLFQFRWALLNTVYIVTYSKSLLVVCRWINKLCKLYNNTRLCLPLFTFVYLCLSLFIFA